MWHVCGARQGDRRNYWRPLLLSTSTGGFLRSAERDLYGEPVPLQAVIRVSDDLDRERLPRPAYGDLQDRGCPASMTALPTSGYWTHCSISRSRPNGMAGESAGKMAVSDMSSEASVTRISN